MSDFYSDDFIQGTPEWKKKELRSDESPTSPHKDTDSEPPHSKRFHPDSRGGHIHDWEETDEGHPDGHMTAICSDCGSGITYYPTVHSVVDGKLISHGSNTSS